MQGHQIRPGQFRRQLRAEACVHAASDQRKGAFSSSRVMRRKDMNEGRRHVWDAMGNQRVGPGDSQQVFGGLTCLRASA